MLEFKLYGHVRNFSSQGYLVLELHELYRCILRSEVLTGRFESAKKKGKMNEEKKRNPNVIPTRSSDRSMSSPL